MPEQFEGDAEAAIEKGAAVTLHFSLALRDGTEIDSNYERRPAHFTVGDGSLLPGFEATLMGKRAGEKVRVELSPEQAFGAVNQANIQHLPRSRFATLLASSAEPVVPGTVLAFADGAGNDIPGVLQSLDEDTLVVDFNHPLAGRHILFCADIVRVLPPGVAAVKLQSAAVDAMNDKRGLDDENR